MADTLTTPQTPANANDERSWEEALEEAINLFEQGESLNQERFAELLEELKRGKVHADHLPADDPRLEMMAALRERASKLEASAALGTGPTDQISSLLGGLTGQPSKTTAPAVTEIEGRGED
ncbi:hypothetical protein [Brevundimonas sp. GN22]